MVIPCFSNYILNCRVIIIEIKYNYYNAHLIIKKDYEIIGRIESSITYVLVFLL